LGIILFSNSSPVTEAMLRLQVEAFLRVAVGSEVNSPN
jgi:hypothetical protein